MTVRFALLGAGRIGAVHAAALADHPDCRLAVVASGHRESAERLAAPYGARAVADLADALAADVDAVLIASPTAQHVPQIVAAYDAGKAILCEKPVGLDLAAADAAIAHLGDAARRVMIGFNRRFDPSFAEAHRRAAAGEVGQIEQVTIISRDPAGPPAAYLRGSGGLFHDMTIHDLDMARFLLGEIVEVSAMGQTFDPDIAALGDVDGAVVTLRAASGAMATIVNKRHCASGYDQRLEIAGSAGALTVDNARPTLVRSSSAQVTDAAEPYLDFFLERYAAAYRAELGAFVDALLSGAPITPDLLDGRAALVLADAATASARTGERVRL